VVVSVHLEIRIHLEVMDHNLKVHEDSARHPDVPLEVTIEDKGNAYEEELLK
jgi:hypothetical protein